MFVVRDQELWYRAMSEAWKRTWLLPQILLVFTIWLFLFWLHWNNNGLWPGDAPRHAANGLFWKDYLLSLSLDPKGFALSYHARYPVISPTTYPPVFYIIEAVFYGAFGSSPYVAKNLVLGFTLIAALYTTAWSRRWIAEDAGWAGVLFVLLPGVVRWSHAIMLNIPALALSIGALYHFRRWLESPTKSPLWNHLYIAATLTVLSILTYVTSCVLLLIVGMWLLIERRWYLLRNKRALLVFIFSSLSLLPWIIVVLKFESMRIQMATGTVDQFISIPWKYYLECIVYYLKCLPDLFGIHILFITVCGIVGGIYSRRWRHETILMLIMAMVCFFFFVYVPAKEDRYIMLLSVPIVCFCLIYVQTMILFLGKLARLRSKQTKIVNIAIVILLIGQAWLASRVHVRYVFGYEQLVEFMEKIAPEESIFYDGRRYAMFTFHVQARDPNYRRRVVLGRKLIYAENQYSSPEEFVSSSQDVIEVLQKKGGCQWLIVADHPDDPQIAAAWYLREAVKEPQFELVKSFLIDRITIEGVEDISNISVYRFLSPINRVDMVDMPLFSLGEGVYRKVKPIQR
jgi:4-amino-4-deoxy-L-arabinose transferase-like glycosyltransferase